MNNKIRISNFFNAGGIVEVRLIPEVKFINKEFPLFYFANDMKSFKKLWNDIRRPYYFTRSIGINNFEYYIANIIFSLNGILYNYDKNIGLFEYTIWDDLYLFATDKYYRGSQLN